MIYHGHVKVEEYGLKALELPKYAECQAALLTKSLTPSVISKPRLRNLSRISIIGYVASTLQPSWSWSNGS